VAAAIVVVVVVVVVVVIFVTSAHMELEEMSEVYSVVSLFNNYIISTILFVISYIVAKQS